MSSTPRYDTDVDLSNENMSQSLIAALVGRDRRVLDVGCATGYTAEALASQGCTVVGLEPDADSAEQARPHVSRLFVSTVEDADLVTELGSGSQDAIVFGDVLEHLVDPAATLRAVLPLLAEGGAVVASIPHVAHGAVRLALLQGRFDYTETGLLDETHLRLFTLAGLHRMFAAAGLEVVEMRRTVLALTQTEIPLDEGDFPAEVVEKVLDDPEATTYQFVARAVPVAAVSEAQRSAFAAAEAARVREHRAGRATAVRTVPRAAGVTLDTRLRVGVWGQFDVDDLGPAVTARVAEVELRRRLPGAHLRLYSPYGTTRGVPLGDLAVEPLGPLGEEQAARLCRDLDAVVVLGDAVADPAAAAALYGDELREDHPALWVRNGPPLGVLGAGTDADLLALTPRLLPLEVAEARLRLLRASGGVPEAPRLVLVQGSAADLHRVGLVAAALDALVEADPDLAVVLLEAEASRGDAVFLNALATTLTRTPAAVTLASGLEDILTLVAGAEAVVATSVDVRAVALAYGTAAVDLAGLVAQGLPVPGGARSTAAADAADLALDELALQLGSAEGPPRPVDVAGRLHALEEAHARLQDRLRVQRVALAGLLGAPSPVHQRGELERLRAKVDELDGHILAMNSTLTMRAVRPARAAYGRLRSRAGR